MSGQDQDSLADENEEIMMKEFSEDTSVTQTETAGEKGKCAKVHLHTHTHTHRKISNFAVLGGGQFTELQKSWSI